MFQIAFPFSLIIYNYKKIGGREHPFFYTLIINNKGNSVISTGRDIDGIVKNSCWKGGDYFFQHGTKWSCSNKR